MEQGKKLGFSAGAGFEHIHQGIDGFEQFETAFRDAVSDHGIIHIHLKDKALVDQIVKVFLYLMIAHVGGIHDFRLAGTIFAYTEHIGNYLDIGAAPPHFFGEG